MRYDLVHWNNDDKKLDVGVPMIDTGWVTIGSLISDAMDRNGWTLSEMARRLKKGRGQLWGWKNDEFLPTKPNLKRLAKVLGRSYAELAEIASAQRYS